MTKFVEPTIWSSTRSKEEEHNRAMFKSRKTGIIFIKGIYKFGKT